MIKRAVCYMAIFTCSMLFTVDQVQAQSLILFNQIYCADSDDINEILHSHYIVENPVVVTDIMVRAKIRSRKCVALDLSDKIFEKIHFHYVISPQTTSRVDLFDTKSFTIYETSEGYVVKIFDFGKLFSDYKGPEV